MQSECKDWWSASCWQGAGRTISVGIARETVLRAMQAAARGVQTFEMRHSEQLRYVLLITYQQIHGRCKEERVSYLLCRPGNSSSQKLIPFWLVSLPSKRDIHTQKKSCPRGRHESCPGVELHLFLTSGTVGGGDGSASRFIQGVEPSGTIE